MGLRIILYKNKSRKLIFIFELPIGFFKTRPFSDFHHKQIPNDQKGNPHRHLQLPYHHFLKSIKERKNIKTNDFYLVYQNIK